MINSKDFDFSFSGLKTAVLYATRKLGDMDDKTKASFAREFEDAVTEVLISKTKKAVIDFGAKSVIFAGGVSANKNIRETLTTEMQKIGVQTIIPHSRLSTDNAVMIAIAGYFRRNHEPALPDLRARGNIKIA